VHRKEHIFRALKTIDGPSSNVILALIESDGILYVSIKANEEVHVVDAVHFMWAANDIQLSKAYQKLEGHKPGLHAHYEAYRKGQT
jgi:hypothetical protein